MLLRRSIKKIILSSLVLCLLLLVYIMPSNKKDDIKINTTLEYVNSDLKTHEIFLLDNNNYISKTEIVIKSTDRKDMALELINTLIIDGKYEDKIPNGFKAMINSNTKINNIEVLDNTIKIDFNEYLLDTTKNYEEKIIEAITYTLTSIENINNIIIYINGKLLNYLPLSKINLPTSLDRGFGINKEYNITGTKDINKTTIYYMSTFNDSIYYTPITKVTNNSKEKIEIIIDELSDTSVNSNLTSYLNHNTKLVNKELNDDNMVIDFNEYILSNLEEREILDSVIDTITMSIYDNYDINGVIFKVNGEEIIKKELKSIE